jgi:hypothetical protein
MLPLRPFRTEVFLSVAVFVAAASLRATASDEPPVSKDVAKLARYDASITKEQRRHWAYQPVTAPRVPRVKNQAWVRNPIDAFILARLQEQGWQPAPPAAPRAWLRRAYFDLIGLPPSLAEQEAFLKNPTPDAGDRLVQELLARPAYGERWGRHWLDLVRYAETNGYERDAAKPYVWRYRDYVIQCFNEDRPYDRFILEQLAGDELPEADSQTIIATGYYRLGPWDDEPADFQEDRFDQLNDMVSTTSLAFLGLTVGCARCHDHKFDAITMHDYYRLVAVFNPLRRPQNGRTELVLPAGSRMQIAAQQQRDQDIRKVQDTALPYSVLPRRGLELAILNSGVVAHKAQYPDLPLGYFLQEPSPKAPETHLLIRGKAARPGPVVQPGVPAVLVQAQPKFPASDGHTTLRRLTLAHWIASPHNPLTARVMVNRVWQHHFGEGLVRTPSDFGVMGQPPTHPELLDWLADWFMRHGWSLKKLHYLIMSSNTYRMSTVWNKGHAVEDPENRLLWRFPPRRLEVEAIRDAMLAVSGRLNRKMFGPSMYPHVPRDVLLSHADLDKIWKASPEDEASRRTIYAHTKRSLLVPFLEVLDFCDTAQSTERRQRTTVATQALVLFNSHFVNLQARHFAQRLLDEAGADDAKVIERAWLLALCRPPRPAETKRMQQFLRQEMRQLLEEATPTGHPLSASEARCKALEQLCRVVFNLNEFVYVD